MAQGHSGQFHGRDMWTDTSGPHLGYDGDPKRRLLTSRTDSASVLTFAFRETRRERLCNSGIPDVRN